MAEPGRSDGPPSETLLSAATRVDKKKFTQKFEYNKILYLDGFKFVNIHTVVYTVCTAPKINKKSVTCLIGKKSVIWRDPWPVYQHLSA